MIQNFGSPSRFWGWFAINNQEELYEILQAMIDEKINQVLPQKINEYLRQNLDDYSINVRFVDGKNSVSTKDSIMNSIIKAIQK